MLLEYIVDLISAAILIMLLVGTLLGIAENIKKWLDN